MIDEYFIETIPSPQYYPHKNYHTAIQDQYINVNNNVRITILAVARKFQLQKQSIAVCNKHFF